MKYKEELKNKLLDYERKLKTTSKTFHIGCMNFQLEVYNWLFEFLNQISIGV
jgi:hypothetical protein